jgi:hypothetical protein
MILQLNIGTVKVENYADMQSEHPEEVYIPSPFSVKEAEPKVSPTSLLLFVSLCLCFFECLQGRMMKFWKVFSSFY